MTSANRPRKERKENADKRRRQILDATYRSIVSNGLARTTLATVANEAGLSQGVAVFYFKSKNGLLTEALRDLYQAYEKNWQKALDKVPDDPVSQLVAIIRADFDKKVCNPESLSVWFAFWGEQKFTPQYEEITREFDLRRTEAIKKICLRLLPNDAERALDLAQWVDTLTDGYWQHLHLYSGQYSRQDTLAGTVRFLCAQLPEHAAALKACADKG